MAARTPVSAIELGLCSGPEGCTVFFASGVRRTFIAVPRFDSRREFGSGTRCRDCSLCPRRAGIALSCGCVPSPPPGPVRTLELVSDDVDNQDRKSVVQGKGEEPRG